MVYSWDLGHRSQPVHTLPALFLTFCVCIVYIVSLKVNLILTENLSLCDLLVWLYGISKRHTRSDCTSSF
jgi:hypothetical protein